MLWKSLFLFHKGRKIKKSKWKKKKSTMIHSARPASSDHYSRLNFVLFCEILKSRNGRTDGRKERQTTCVKTGLDCDRPRGSKKKNIRRDRERRLGIIYNHHPHWSILLFSEIVKLKSNWTSKECNNISFILSTLNIWICTDIVLHRAYVLFGLLVCLFENKKMC